MRSQSQDLKNKINKIPPAKLVRKQERILLVVSKPLTRIYPEIFDENNEYPTQHFQPTNNSDNTYRLSRKNINKTGIFNENFGL